MLAGRRLRGVEERRARAPRDGRGNLAALMRRDDVVELPEALQADDEHECAVQLRSLRSGGPTRRLAERDVQREERGEEIVLEASGARADLGRHGVGREQVEEGLLRVQAGRDEVGGELFAGAEFDSGGTTVADEDLLQLDAATDFPAVLRDVCDEAAREVAGAAHAHLRLRGRREQGRDGVAETGLTQVHFAQAVEEEQARADGVVLEVLRDELQRRERGDFEQATA